MKKTLLVLLALSLIAGAAIACGGPGAMGALGIIPTSDYIEPDNELLDVNDDNDGADIDFDVDDIKLPDNDGGYDLENVAAYYLVRGEVVSVERNDGVTYVKVIDQYGNEAVLVLNDDTVFPFSDSFEVGDTVTGWYRTDMPMAMIYPPQHNVAVLVAGAPDDANVRVGRFHNWEDNTEGYFLSQGGDFAFRTDENTEILLEDGTALTSDDLNNRRIVVIYGISTRSIPEMTTADKLIVLFESIMPMG